MLNANCYNSGLCWNVKINIYTFQDTSAAVLLLIVRQPIEVTAFTCCAANMSLRTRNIAAWATGYTLVLRGGTIGLIESYSFSSFVSCGPSRPVLFGPVYVVGTSDVAKQTFGMLVSHNDRHAFEEMLAVKALCCGVTAGGFNSKEKILLVQGLAWTCWAA